MAEKINYNLDTTELPPKTYEAQDPESKSLADYIRTKSHGRHVRESVARSVELNSNRSYKAEKLAEEILVTSKETQERLDKQIGALTEDAEVIDSRGNYPVLGERLNAINSKIDSQPINVLELGVLNDGTDSTVAMQDAVNTYQNLYIPDGNYTFGDIVLNGETYLQVEPNAKITITGSWKSANQTDLLASERVLLTQVANKGSYKLYLNDVSTFKVGNEIGIYDGGWQSPEEWETNSLLEGKDFFKIQHNKIIAINTDNTITLENPLEFTTVEGKGGVMLAPLDDNIIIQGGQWYLTGGEVGFYIQNVNNFEFRNVKVFSVSAKVPIKVSYSTNIKIKNNYFDCHNNVAIQVFYATDNVDIATNSILVSDKFSGDGAIQLYAYITRSVINGNLVRMRHVNGDFSNFAMGIVLHTCENNIVSNNRVSGFYYGVASYYGAKYNKFSNNDISDCLTSGILIHRTWYTDIVNNNIHSNGLYDGWANPQRAGITILNKSSYVNIVNNNFHDNRHDILVMDNSNNFNVSGNNSNLTWGSFIRLRKKGTDLIKALRWTVSNNNYRPSNKEANTALINNYDELLTESIIQDNIVNGANNGLYLRMHSNKNRISGNRFNDTPTGIYLSYESTLNTISDNYFTGNTTTAINANGQAKLNIYQRNHFDGNAQDYNFTDDFNRSSDNVSMAITAPIGWRVYSISPTNTVDYWERRTKTNGNLLDYVTVNK